MVATVSHTNSRHRGNPATCSKVYPVFTVQTSITYKKSLLMTGFATINILPRVSGLVIHLSVIDSDANITIKPSSRVTRRNAESPEQITFHEQTP